MVEVPPNHVVDRNDTRKIDAFAAYCVEMGVSKVLIRAPVVAVKLSTMEIFAAAERIVQSKLRIAFCVSNHEASQRDVSFFETVAVNRGGSVKFFESESEALDWLGT